MKLVLQYLRYEFNIPEDVSTFALKFKYKFITQEYSVESETDSMSVWIGNEDDTSKTEILRIDNTNPLLSDNTLRASKKNIVGLATDWLEEFKQIFPPTLPIKTGGKLFLNFKIENKGNKNRYPFFLLDYLESFISTKTTIPAFSVKQLDVFEAVFGGSFETNLEDTGWISHGSCRRDFAFGQFIAKDGNYFLNCNTTPSEENAWVTRKIDIPKDVTSIPITLDYNFISQEYPKNGTSEWDIIELSIKSGIKRDKETGETTDPGPPPYRLIRMASDNIGLVEDEFVYMGQIINMGMTGWQTLSLEVPVTSGEGEFKIMMRNEGSGNGLHSALLIDNIRLAIPD